MWYIVIICKTFLFLFASYEFGQCSTDKDENSFEINKTFLRQKRKFLNVAQTWPVNGPFYYKIDKKITNYNETSMIDKAMREMTAVTCLDFLPAPDWTTNDDLSILYLRGLGCSSNIGRRFYSGPQGINLDPQCFSAVGVVYHEILHVFGFTHEHNRPDRDQYVTVLWENIEYGFASQFERLTTAQVLTEPAEYDLGSVMHYRTTTFSKHEDGLPVIRTNDPDYQWTIGQRSELSFMDVKFLNYIYCKDKCQPNPHCQRGSYAHPKYCDRCVCPSGFSGAWCDEVKPGVNANCGGLVELGGTSSSSSVIHSPNYPSQYDFDQQCSWLIRCPADKRVKLDFLGTIDVSCKATKLLCLDYVEVRKGGNFTNTGPRFCCDFYPRNGIISDGFEMLVLFRSFQWARKTGFQATVKCY